MKSLYLHCRHWPLSPSVLKKFKLLCFSRRGHFASNYFDGLCLHLSDLNNSEIVENQWNSSSGLHSAVKMTQTQNKISRKEIYNAFKTVSSICCSVSSEGLLGFFLNCKMWRSAFKMLFSKNTAWFLERLRRKEISRSKLSCFVWCLWITDGSF